MAIIQNSFNNKIYNVPNFDATNLSNIDFYPFIKILNAKQGLQSLQKIENLDIQIFFYTNQPLKFLNFKISDAIGSKFDPIDVKGYTQTYYKFSVPATKIDFEFEVQYTKINETKTITLSTQRDFSNVFNLNVDLYNQGQWIDNIITLLISSQRNLNIFYQTTPSTQNSLYLYDLSDPEYQSRFPVSYFKFSDYNRNAITINNFNNVLETNEKMKFNTRVRCAFYFFDTFLKKNKLVFSPINHYQIAWKTLKIVNKIRKFYPVDYYQFFQENPFNINETITTTFYLPLKEIS